MIGAIIIGLIAGWLAGKIVRGEGYGMFADILLDLPRFRGVPCLEPGEAVTRALAGEGARVAAADSRFLPLWRLNLLARDGYYLSDKP